MAKKKTTTPDDPSTNSSTRRRSQRTANAGAIVSAADLSAGLAPSPSSVYAPSYDEIAEVAYQRYLSRGGEHGQDWNDWLEAERELRSRP